MTPVTYVAITIEATSPWRIGGWDETQDGHDLLAALKDANGRVIVPASGLAGSLRASLSDMDVLGLMGGVTGSGQSAQFTASPTWFLGAEVSNATPHSRGTTAVSRHRRAALVATSHRVEEVSTGSQVILYLKTHADPARLLERISEWAPTLGGGTSTGMGQAKITRIKHRTLHLANPHDLLVAVSAADKTCKIKHLLREVKPTRTWSPAGAASPVLRAKVNITDLQLHMSNNQDTADRPEHRTLHGSRWKGILRSRVEYIGRTCGLNPCSNDDSTGISGCGDCAVCRVFGSTKTGMGAWSFTDTPLDEPRRQRTRVAIDRFTGGVKHSATFPEATRSAHAEFQILGLSEVEDRDAWVAKALLLALKDLHQGFMGVGGRGATGLGQVQFGPLKLAGQLADMFPGFTDVDQAPRLEVNDLAVAGLEGEV